MSCGGVPFDKLRERRPLSLSKRTTQVGLLYSAAGFKAKMRCMSANFPRIGVNRHYRE